MPGVVGEPMITPNCEDCYAKFDVNKLLVRPIHIIYCSWYSVTLFAGSFNINNERFDITHESSISPFWHMGHTGRCMGDKNVVPGMTCVACRHRNIV